MSDVLFGYRAHGQHLPDQWYFVCDEGRDVGALLLANHPTSGNWELVYMGATPSARGAGLGKQIVEFALDAAFRADVEQLVLAVDVDNDPAIRIYRAAGFQEWNRCSVYARLARD